MIDTDAANAYIVNRYSRWGGWPQLWAYKHAKGARILQIIKETGGFVPVALEIGVGPAGVATAVSRGGIRVIGIDLSPAGLALARVQSRGSDVRLIRASGFSLPVRDGSLELVYASQVMHLFDNPGRLTILHEVHRVLTPGGRFIFDMKNLVSHPWRYLASTSARRRRNFPSHRALLDLLREAGFRAVVTRPGLLPRAAWPTVPNLGLFRHLAHTTFFVATKSLPTPTVQEHRVSVLCHHGPARTDCRPRAITADSVEGATSESHTRARRGADATARPAVADRG